jgi:Ca2+-binding EF-hand superfamily protein
MKKTPCINLALSAMVIVFFSARSYGAASPDPITAYDSDNDKTIDLAEISKAANDQFTNLEIDHDGTLDAKELRGKLSTRDLKEADPDSDGTVSKDEFMTYVESIFKNVDSDNDGTIDAKEFKSKKGKALLRLIR